VTRRGLFSIDGFETREEQDDEHLQGITEILGPLPQHLLALWPNRADFVTDSGELLPDVVEEGIGEPLDELIDLYCPESMRGEELDKRREREEFLSLLRGMLKVRPEERKSAAELLKSEWLNRA